MYFIDKLDGSTLTTGGYTTLYGRYFIAVLFSQHTHGPKNQSISRPISVIWPPVLI